LRLNFKFYQLEATMAAGSPFAFDSRRSYIDLLNSGSGRAAELTPSNHYDKTKAPNDRFALQRDVTAATVAAQLEQLEMDDAGSMEVFPRRQLYASPGTHVPFSMNEELKVCMHPSLLS
jgi:hypothetical protein